MRGLGAKIGLEHPQNRPQHRHTGQSELAAFILEDLDQVLLEQRIKHQAGRFGDFRHRQIQLLLRAYHRVQMLDRRHIGVVRRRRARDRNQGLAGGVGNQMEMKISRLGHLYGVSMNCGQDGRRPRLGPLSKPSRRASVKSVHKAAELDIPGAPLRPSHGNVDGALGIARDNDANPQQNHSFCCGLNLGELHPILKSALPGGGQIVDAAS